MFQSSSILLFSFYLIAKLIYWISFFIELEKKWNFTWTLNVIFVHFKKLKDCTYAFSLSSPFSKFLESAPDFQDLRFRFRLRHVRSRIGRPSADWVHLSTTTSSTQNWKKVLKLYLFNFSLLFLTSLMSSECSPVSATMQLSCLFLVASCSSVYFRKFGIDLFATSQTRNLTVFSSPQFVIGYQITEGLFFSISNLSIL